MSWQKAWDDQLKKKEGFALSRSFTVLLWHVGVVDRNGSGAVSGPGTSRGEGQFSGEPAVGFSLANTLVLG